MRRASSTDVMTRKGGDEEHAKKFLGTTWAPLAVPMKRRRQMFACVLMTMIFQVHLVSYLLCLWYWRYTWPLIITYLPYCVFDNTPQRGGVKETWPGFRNCWLFRWFIEYFPITLVKSDPAVWKQNRPHVFGYHPHGILSYGALAVGTDAAGMKEKFPELDPVRLCTLNLTLALPILRELLLRVGFIAAERASINCVLKRGGNAMIVVGGAAEALDTRPGHYVLTLRKRTGFFRLALQYGARLTPVFGFGENDMYETVDAQHRQGYFRRLQRFLLRQMRFSLPIFYGRGIFSYSHGPFPYRRPVTVVVGNPIDVDKVENPTDEDIEKLKEQYIEGLRVLFAEWQPRLEPSRSPDLIIV